MEKIDILFAALIIVVFIFTAYISYLKAKTDFLLYLVNQHTDAISGLASIADSQRILYIKQREINNNFIEFNEAQIKLNNKFDKHIRDRYTHFPSPTGGRRSEAEAQS